MLREALDILACAAGAIIMGFALWKLAMWCLKLLFSESKQEKFVSKGRRNPPLKEHVSRLGKYLKGVK